MASLEENTEEFAANDLKTAMSAASQPQKFSISGIERRPGDLCCG